MYKQVDELLQKEMSRQDFLKTVGVGLLAVFGFSSVFKMLNGMSGHGGNHKVANAGYGSSPYGGNLES